MTDRSLRLPILMTIGALVVSGAYVRVWGLWDYFLTPDEALVLQISSQPRFVDVLIAASYHPHPPLRYIVLHSMVSFDDNPLFLRSFSLLPGVALIPLLFLLGRRTAGTASGITMATIAAFSHAAMMLSEVLRTYVLGTFFVTVGLYAFFSYLEKRRSMYLYLYGTSMALGLLSHYFTVLPVAAVSIVWVCFAARSRQPLRELIRAVLANLPCAVLALASYVLHLSSRNGTHWWKNSIDTGHLASQFPDTVYGLVVNAAKLFHFLFSSTAWWLAVLALLGMTALWKMKRRAVVMVIMLTITINIFLTLAKKYPFGGARQSFYLLPLILIPIGAAVQFGWDRARSWFSRTADADFLRSISAHGRSISFVALACFVVCLFGVSHSIARSDFSRRSDGRGSGELPVRQDDVTEVVEYLRERVSAHDIILADRQTTLYARLALGMGPEGISGTVSNIIFSGLGLFYSNQDYRFFFDNDEVLWRSLEDLIDHREISEDTTIWILSIGWQPVEHVMAEQIWSRLIVDKRVCGGASVYAFKGSEIAAEAVRRFGR